MSSTAQVEHTVHRDYTGSKLGMWLFLVTELLLFGGMFLLYSVYRYWNPQEFHNAAKELNVFLGSLNTLILITSSLTMALSIATIQKGNKTLSLWFIAGTILLGIVFLVNKYFEWSEKIHHGIYPDSALLEKLGKGESMFYGLYYTMTGLHGFHVLAGIVLLSIMFVFVLKRPYYTYTIEQDQFADASKMALIGSKKVNYWESEGIDSSLKRITVKFEYNPAKEKFKKEDFVALENAGLYWHVVDIIWIFLFPLFYLIT